MAYCRCDNICKVYMYATFNGFMFHLANDVDLKDPTASRDFHIASFGDALRKLKRLQIQGFGVPQYAIDRLAKDYGM